MNNQRKLTPSQRALVIEQIYRREHEPYRYYVPTGKLEDYIRIIGEGETFISCLFAANGIGKTYLMLNMIANIIWPCGNKYFQLPIFCEEWRYPKTIRIVSDHINIIQNIVPKMYKIFPPSFYSVDKKGKMYEAQWKMKNGWTIYMMTYDQDPKEFEGPDIGFTWLDEPPPEYVYKGCISRHRLGGYMAITATPLSGSAWLYDTVVANKNNESGTRGYVEADVESACKEHGVRGFLEHAHIERMIAQYNEEEKWARIKGRFQHLTGLVFKQFDRRIHCIDPFDISMQDYCVYEYLDPHPRNPDAVLWLAIDKNNTKYVIDELYIKVNSDEELANRIKNKATQYRICNREADPSAFNENQHDRGESLADKLNKLGLNYKPASKQRHAADRKIGSCLDFTMVEDKMIKPPELYIFNTCQRLIYELEHYRWDEWSGRTAEKKDKKEKPIDKDDHMIENLGRGLLANNTFVPIPDNFLDMVSSKEGNYKPLVGENIWNTTDEGLSNPGHPDNSIANIM